MQTPVPSRNLPGAGVIALSWPAVTSAPVSVKERERKKGLREHPGRASGALGAGRRTRDLACQTWIEGTFTGPFTHSPAGELQANGARVVWDLMSMFRFDDRGRLVEEFVRTDNRSFLRQLCAQFPDLS
jgi:hypothetical protein